MDRGFMLCRIAGGNEVTICQVYNPYHFSVSWKPALHFEQKTYLFKSSEVLVPGPILPVYTVWVTETIDESLMRKAVLCRYDFGL